MTITTSVFNMKGGVGKTTLTVQLAWYLMAEKGLRVLVVDLDPQANASHYLMGAENYKDYIQEDRPTSKDVFEQYHIPTQLHPTDSFIYGVRAIQDAKLDLVPSSLKLSKILKNPRGKEHALNNFLVLLSESYDVIFIDCPPTETMLTTAAYRSSDYLLIPIKPEFLSTIGLPLIIESTNEFRQAYDRSDLEVAGIVFNMVNHTKEASHSKLEIKQLASANGWICFDEEISSSESYTRSVREIRSIKETRYTRSSTTEEFARFAEAFVRRIGV